jgi:hypothetical protein
MAIPGSGMIGRIMGESMKLLGPVTVAGSAYMGYRGRVDQGQNRAFALATEGAFAAGSMMLSGPAYAALMYGLPAAQAVGAAGFRAYLAHEQSWRQMKTPFSHRFEHSQVTAAMQARGLQALGAAWGHSRMGAEAASFARRYGRQ